MSKTRIALVTGANQGVGFQVAKELVANGVTVYLGSRNLQRGEAAASEIGPGATALQIDVTQGASIAAAAERIRSERGRLDLLVNNAGISNTRRSEVAGEEQNSQSFLEEYAKSSKASTASLDEIHAVLGHERVWHARGLPGHAATASRVLGRPHRQCVERGRLARFERRPLTPVPRQIRAHLSRVEGG